MTAVLTRPGHRLSRQADRARRWLGRRRGLASIQGARDPALSSIADAIEAGRLDRMGPEERDWIARIEAVRARLEASEDEIRTIASEYSGDPADDAVSVDRVGELCRRASHPPLWARILFGLTRRRKPRSCLELGTCLGLSAAYQGAGLELNAEGRLISLEGARERAELATRNIAELRLDHRVEVRAGRFAETFETALEDLRPLDYAFIDGHHDEVATQAYFDRICECASPDALLVFDDITWSDGMRRAWASIRGDSRVATAIDLGPVGLCLLGPRRPLAHVSIPVA